MALTRIEGYIDSKLGESGYAIKETIRTDGGQTWEVRWAVWTKQPLVIGDFVQVDGDLGVKVREYQDINGNTKNTVDRNLNNATVKVIKPNAPETGNEPF